MAHERDYKKVVFSNFDSVYGLKLKKMMGLFQKNSYSIHKSSQEVFDILEL